MLAAPMYSLQLGLVAVRSTLPEPLLTSIIRAVGSRVNGASVATNKQIVQCSKDIL